MINHSGIGTYLSSTISVLVNNFFVTLLGNEIILKSFPWFEKVRVINCKSDIYSVAEQLELPLKIPRCNLFLSPHYNIPLLPIKAKRRVVIIHDVYHLAFIKELPIHQKIYARLMINSAARLSDRIITVSEFSKSEIIKYTGTPAKKIHIVYLGVDTPGLNPTTNDSSDRTVKQKYKLPDHYLLYVGNIKPNKNLKNLLHAFKKELKNNPDIKLVIVGKSEGFITQDIDSIKIIENDITLSESTIFTGYVEHGELPSIYKLATALVFPSFYEGSGLPPLEAMSYGCPVLASSSASIPEICGDAAFYFNPNNFDEIADKIELILTNENLRLDLIQKGRANIRRFSKDEFSEKLNFQIHDIISD